MEWTTSAVAAALRLAGVGALLLFGYPLLLLPRRPQWDANDRLAAAGYVGTFFVVAAAYVLAPVHLFESLGLFLTGLIVLGVVIWRRDGANTIFLILQKPQDMLMRTLDRFADPPAIDEVAAALQAEARAEEERARAARPKRRIKVNWPVLGLALVVTGVACWVRFTDAVTHPAPTPSDFIVHLQWLKWLTMPEHGLFGDYVYPKGMHAVAAALRFLSQESPYAALRMSGPVLNGMWLAGIWYVVKRMTGSGIGGLVAVALYLAAPRWLPGEAVRLAYALPEEFAMGFLLPAGWFAYRYLTDGDWMDALLAAMAAAIVGGTHWGVLVHLAATFIAVTAAALPRRFGFKRLATLVGWVVGGTAAGLLPQGIALLLGVPIYPTTEGFGIGDARAYYAPLSITVLIVAALILALAIMGMRDRPELLVLPLITVVFILIDYLPALGLPMPVLALRGKNFITMALVGGLGVTYAMLEQVVGLRKREWVACLVGLGMIGGIYAVNPPAPAKMEPLLTDEFTTQVLRLTTLTPASYEVIARPETLSLVLGSGFQIDSAAWLNAFPVPPAEVTIAKVLADNAKPRPGRPEDTPNLYFFVESDPYVDQVTRAKGFAEERITSTERLRQWVLQYGETHPKAVQTYYESPTLTIYLIEPPKRG